MQWSWGLALFSNRTGRFQETFLLGGWERATPTPTPLPSLSALSPQSSASVLKPKSSSLNK